jgi:hypothetical protein
MKSIVKRFKITLVKALVSSMVDARADYISTDHVAQSVIDAHPRIEGEDANFYVSWCYLAIRDDARKHVNRYKPKPDGCEDDSMTIPGFERLQQYYQVGADSEHGMIRLELIPTSELVKKAEELFQMGKGCYTHGEEILKYARLRDGKISEAA